ncbi:hypothetical protein [Vibrio phage vB_VmeM-Yong XC32]|nr:hypothetical protein [Vibrio phage vB_VmeM-Yong XC31]QAX96380.1 hypothetical protein [Vibrio phage vB_VmeM-Yong XC32]QAX96698.1 hypothetical protein [Vibrio phage vB_VmeM-Yong MS31]QAX97016.1 hypothetical protein [Vibrio phage vB_VmeM-Yong MS32]
MLKLFSTFTGLDRGETIEAGLNRVLQLQAKNIAVAETYYQNQYVPTDMTNPLIRLCYRFNWELTTEPVNYYNRAKEEMQELCLNTGITSSANEGDIFEGLFYGENVKTVMVAEADAARRNRILSQPRWKDIRPVRVLTRPGVKGSYVRPDLIEYNEGHCVISVDIPALAYMFRGWIEDNLKLPVEQQKQPFHFVCHYVLPSMMWSQQDATLINSLVIGADAWKEDAGEFSTFLAINNMTDSLLRTTYGLVKEVGTQTATWEKLLSHIPSFIGEDMSTALPQFFDRKTIKNEWVELIAMLPIATVCAKYAKNNPESTMVDNLWKEYSRYLKNQRIISKIPDKKLIAQVDEAFAQFVIEYS